MRTLLVAVLLLAAVPAHAAGPAKKANVALARCLAVGVIAGGSRDLLPVLDHFDPGDQRAIRAHAVSLATHDKAALVAAARGEVAKVPAPVRAKILAFCRTPAGKAYTKLLHVLYGYPPPDSLMDNWPKDMKDKKLLDRATAFVSATHVDALSWAQVLLLFRNTLGTRVLLHYLDDNPKAAKADRQSYAPQIKGKTMDQVKKAYADFQPKLETSVLETVTVLLDKVPPAQVEAMLHFFETDAGEAASKAMYDALSASMDGAWKRTTDRFVSGKLKPAPAKAKKN